MDRSVARKSLQHVMAMCFVVRMQADELQPNKAMDGGRGSAQLLLCPVAFKVKTIQSELHKRVPKLL